MTRKLTITTIKEGKWFVSKSIELGVVSQGKTIEEAESNLKEAVELYLEDQPLKRKNLPVTAPHVSWIDF